MFQVRWGTRSLWHHLYQRIRPDCELAIERPVINTNQQNANGRTSCKQAHGDHRGAPVIGVHDSHGDKNTNQFNPEAIFTPLIAKRLIRTR